MSNYRIVIQYDGTRYSGWQRQKTDSRTIQGKIEAVLERLTGAPVRIDGAGRTDAGVHARYQVANFRLKEEQKEYLLSQIKKDGNGSTCEHTLFVKMNEYLPEDIRIIKAEEAGERFHSRLNATGKEYRYHLLKKDCYDVFLRKYSWQMDKKLDVAKMRQATGIFTGTHDFKGYCSKSSKKKSTVRRIDEIRIEETETGIWICFCGNGFLYNMVRILTGTLVKIGTGEYTVEQAQKALDLGERSYAGETAPAQGLTLWKVRYD